jgi:hypothetical protein
MKVAPFDESAFHMDHPRGTVSFNAGRGRGPASSRPEGGKRRERRSNKFSLPRYESVVIMNPTFFNWLPLPDEVGAERKYLGSFTERGFRVEMIKIDAGVEWLSTCESARRLIVGLPPVQLPSTPSDQFDTSESNGAIQFENAKQAV